MVKYGDIDCISTFSLTEEAFLIIVYQIKDLDPAYVWLSHWWVDYCSYKMCVSGKEGKAGVMCFSFKTAKKKSNAKMNHPFSGADLLILLLWLLVVLI